MSNRLTFGECEFLLQCLREMRLGVATIINSSPVDIQTAGDFIGLPVKGDAGTISQREWRDEMTDRVAKLDVLIDKIEGLYGL